MVYRSGHSQCPKSGGKTGSGGGNLRGVVTPIGSCPVMNSGGVPNRAHSCPMEWTSSDEEQLGVERQPRLVMSSVLGSCMATSGLSRIAPRGRGSASTCQFPLLRGERGQPTSNCQPVTHLADSTTYVALVNLPSARLFWESIRRGSGDISTIWQP